MNSDKFTQVYLKNIIAQSMEFGMSGINIPRPNRLKTPPNNYGSNGQNAKYYDLYIQDQAQGVFVDKYGEEKGTKMWESILSIGHAMWKACDQILGQKRTLQDLVSQWFYKHNELKNRTVDFRVETGYIFLWSWWILQNIIDGKKYTADFISECIPTFKGVLKVFPTTTGVLLETAGIDVDNYKLSKKIQAKRDAEAAAKAEAEQKARIKKEEEEQKARNFEQLFNEIKKLTNGNDWRCKEFANQIQNKYYDISVGLQNLLELPQPTNKDQQRIYDIVLKTNKYHTPSVFSENFNVWNAMKLAQIMNNKIGRDAKGQQKRAARKAAANKYGLSAIARQFN